MKPQNQRQIKFSRSKRTLQHRQQYKNGKWGKWGPEKPFKMDKKTSFLPPPLFKLAASYVYYPLEKIRKDDPDIEFYKCHDAAIRGLKKAGKLFSCEYHSTKHGLSWSIEGKLFCEFVVLDLTDTKPMTAWNTLQHLRKNSHSPGRWFQRLEKKSKAMLRVGIVIFGNSYCWVAGSTLPGKEKHDGQL